MKRKVVQIAASSPGRSSSHGYNPGVIALVDDRSVWGAGFNPRTQTFDPWIKLPDIPDTDQEAADILASHIKTENKSRPSLWQMFCQRLGV
ncbi:hypothetical protein [Stutzerimonas stutzeri]|jgi:hypothetical protein|uniref:Uncharacterized protein n=1 Tax=Stutzerimonas stutzeri TaxID=316 RepID=A0AA40RWR3_STUST|nr:hypothetical protein [Stutzerimonas stutzeri]MBA1306078.1 hypothetical protein [Stutzerimonas stutzeri]